jgi:glycyl-tRNA synthetase beta chain
VIVDQDERAAIIRERAQELATEAGLVLVEDEGLVAENAGLTEWPVPLLGRFDPDYLDVPPEVIQLTARTNQKYFVLRDEAGGLANAFICTANIVPSDGGAAIVAGNQRVLAARLSDARFFWEQDLKVPLEEQAKKLSQIVFHEKLGTVADKVERVAKLARWLVEEGVVRAHVTVTPGQAGVHLPADEQVDGPEIDSRLRGENEEVASLADQAERAARLSKADLVTGMVGEFPELQGLIGGYLAAAQGEPKAVADAVRDHYKPVGQGDKVPTAPATVAVALADKLDSLVQFFAADEKPTGSKDPFALRRAMLGAIAITIANSLRLPLHRVLKDQFNSFVQGAGTAFMEFAVDRLKVQQREAGVRQDIIDAVFSRSVEDDLVRLLARVQALQAFLDNLDGTNLLAGYKRAANILKKEEGSWTPNQVRGDELPAEEAALMAALDEAGPRAEQAIEAEDYGAAMSALALLRHPIDLFFDKVTVNDSDEGVRARRLSLLARFRDAVHRVADFSKIEG